MAEAPAYWISALAEELALLADNRDSVGVSALLRYHSALHSMSEKDLTAQIAAEWVRQGIGTVPTHGILRGWIE
jgi:hypothetical protein